MAATKKWHLVIDLALCNDCNCCFLADKDEFTGNDWPPFSKAQPWEGQRWIDIERKERGQFPQIQVVHRPSPCMHCDNAPCMDAAPDGAVYKRPDGLVIIDPEKAAGHPEIVDSCPYGAIFWNEEANVAQKCTGCAHLMDEGRVNSDRILVILTTIASTPAVSEWAEARRKEGHRIAVVKTAVGYAKLANVMYRAEDFMERHPGKDVVIEDATGQRVNIGSDPILLAAW